MISFTTALVLFAFILTGIYTGLLLVSGRSIVSENRENRSVSRIFSIGSFILSSIGVALTLSIDFRETLPYFIIIASVPILVIISRVFGGYRLGLASIILWHIMMYFGKAPYVDIFVGEGSEMVREMRLNDHWDFKWAHNPSYNPIPTMAFIQATLSRIIDVPWHSYILGITIILAWMIAYDLAIYRLTQILTDNVLVSLISIILIGITPETNIFYHSYQWSGNMLTLLALIAIIKVSRSRSNIKETIILLMILFTGSILSHATGLSLFILSLFLFFSREIISILRKLGLLIEESRIIFPVSILLTFLAIFLFRAIYTSGYAGYVLPNFISLYNGFIKLLREFFVPSEEELGEVSHIPLYERAGISPIQAYVWAFVITIATAYIIHNHLIRKRVNGIKILLYMCTISIIFITFIGYGIARFKDFYTFNRTSYVFIPYIVPLAAEAIALTLIKRSRLILIISLLLFSATFPIAAQDPNISPIQYYKIRGSPSFEITPVLYFKARLVSSLIMTSSLEEIYLYSNEYFIKTIVYTSQGLRTEYIYSSKLKETIDLLIFINKIKIPRIMVSTNTSSEYNRVADFSKDILLVR